MKRFLFFALVCISVSVSAQTITWTGAVDVNFNNPGNWSPAQVPLAGNDVVIPTGSTMLINVAASVQSIDIQGNAMVSMNNNLTFTAPSTVGANAFFTWTNGTISGGSTITNNGTFDLRTTSSKQILGLTTFNNEGTFNISSTGDLLISDGVFNNQLNGVIDLQFASGNITYSGASSRILNNYGLIKRTTNAGDASIQVFLNNIGGTISVESGSLTFNTLPKTLTGGTYNVVPGSILNWDITINISGTLTGNLGGIIDWSTTVSAATAATLDFSGANGLNWSLGSLTGGGTVTNNGILNLTTTSGKNISGLTTFNNEGTVNITSPGDLLFVDGIFNNQTNGTIDLQADAGNITYSGSLSRILNNYGLIKRTTTFGDAQIQCSLNNLGGTISVESGDLTLNFLEKTFTDGMYNVVFGSKLTWGVNIVMAGTIQGLVDGDINWSSTVEIPAATVVNFDFNGIGSLNWTISSLTGGGTLINKSLINLTTTSGKSIIGLTTLNNEGDINIISSGDLLMVDGVLNNQPTGVIDMQADGGNITYSGSASRILNNYGLIKKTTSFGDAQIQCNLNNNDGTLSVESGNLTLNFLEKSLTNGDYNVVPGSLLIWGSTTNISGTLQGTLDGNINWSSVVNVPAATTAIFDFSGAGGVNWTISNLTGGGTLVNKSPLNLTTTSGKSILGLTTLNNEGTFTNTSTGNLFLSDGIFNNQPTGVIDLQVDGGHISYSGGTSRILNNFGLIKKSGGAGTILIYSQTTNSGTIDIMAGELEFPDSLGITNTSTGIIKGVGIIDVPSAANYTNDGTFAPGASPGTLNFIGGYESSATSVLDVELNGTNQGVDYDLLTITGPAIMDGVVNVTMGYDGILNEEFIVATTSGLITACNLAPTATSTFNGKQYDFSVACRNDNEVVLTIVLITDIQVPTAITQNITVPLDATGVATITPDDVNNGSFDNCTIPANLILTLDINSWNCNELGDHTVTLTVEDEAGLTDSATAIVTVVAPTTTFTAGTWSPNAPHLGSTAVVNDVYLTSTEGNIDSCLCEVTALGTLNINGGTYVRSARDITVNGTLNVEPEGSVVQIDDLANATNNGSISVQMNTPNMAAQSFMIIGSPMSNETRPSVYGNGYIVRNHITANFIPHPLVEAVSPGINNWADDNGNNWLNYAGNIIPGEGYLVFPQPDGTSSGTYLHNHTQGTLNNGVINFTLGYNGTQNASPNILSNPYASAIDAEIFFAEPMNSAIDVMYFWEHNTAASPGYPGYNVNNFSMMDISMYVEGVGGNPAASGGATPTQYVSAGQGFGVKPSAAGMATFNNSMRVTGNNDTYRNQNAINRDRLWLNVFNDTYQLGSTTLIAFTEFSSDTYVYSEDIKRLATPVSLYSELDTAEELAVNSLNQFNDEAAIFLSFTTQVKELQSYRISIHEKDGLNMENATVYIIDYLTGTITNLSLNDYTFTSGEAVYHKRFKILFKNSILESSDFSIDSIALYPNPTRGVINIVSPDVLITNAKIYDIRGRIVSEVIFTNRENYQIDTSRLDSAIYMVQIFSENGTVTKRIVKE